MSAPETQAAGETASDAITIPAAAFDRDAAEGDAARDAADPPAAEPALPECGDDGPWDGEADVGLTWDLGGGRSLYIGEISEATHEEWGGVELFGPNDGWFAVGYVGRDCVGVLARVPDREAADQLGTLLVGGPRVHRPTHRRVRAGSAPWVPGTPPGARVAAAEAAAAAESERAIAENRRLCDALDALTNAGLALATTANLAQAVAAGARPDPWQPDRAGGEE
jgi:hypothetical protein